MKLRKIYVVELEDKGQDFTSMTISESGEVLSTSPFQTEVWKGAFVPIDMIEVGELLAIHNPPYTPFGHLRYKVVSLTSYYETKKKEVQND